MRKELQGRRGALVRTGVWTSREGVLGGGMTDKEVTDRETSDGETVCNRKANRGRSSNEWTTDREETNSGTADRRISNRGKGGTVDVGTSDRGMEGQRVK